MKGGNGLEKFKIFKANSQSAYQIKLWILKILLHTLFTALGLQISWLMRNIIQIQNHIDQIYSLPRIKLV